MRKISSGWWDDVEKGPSAYFCLNLPEKVMILKQLSNDRHFPSFESPAVFSVGRHSGGTLCHCAIKFAIRLFFSREKKTRNINFGTRATHFSTNNYAGFPIFPTEPGKEPNGLVAPGANHVRLDQVACL